MDEGRKRVLAIVAGICDVRYAVSVGGRGLRTVQQWVGHSDTESTMRYLKPSRSQQVRDKVNDKFA